MKTLTPCLLVVALSSIGLAQTGTRNWAQSPVNGDWYGITDSPTPVLDGQALAQSLGGNLATIRDANEQAWVVSQYTGTTPSAPNTGLWIGYYEPSASAAWQWLSGETTNGYTAWGSNQPNDAGNTEKYCQLNALDNMLWHDANDGCCAGLSPALIELPSLPWTDWLPPYYIPNGSLGTGDGWLGACGDINGDGAPDIVIPDPTIGYPIWLNDGQGWFERGQVVQIGTWPRETQIVDFDLDGDQDIVASDHHWSRGVGVALNDGTGNFGNFTWWQPNNALWGLRCGDFNNDAYPDVVVTMQIGSVYVLLNDTNNGLILGGWSSQTGSNCLFVEVADLDSDGNLDFVTSNDTDNSLTICMGVGDGTFSVSNLPVGTGPLQIAIEDLNADGVPELIVPTLNQLRVFERDPAGTYQVVASISTTARASHPVVRDFNLDGILDLAYSLYGGSALEIAYGISVYQYDLPLQVETGHIFKTIATDVTMDGHPDLVTFGRAGATIHHNLHVLIDCNGNGINDDTDIAGGKSQDCNGNGIPDECQILDDPSLDLNQNGVLDSCECVVDNYCTAAPNTVSATGARIRMLGLPSTSLNASVLEATDCPASEFGIFYYGPWQTQTSFGDGFRCVAGTVFRLMPPTLSSSSGVASRTLDFNAPPINSGAGQINAGSTWNFQYWYRDPTPVGNGFNLSNGLEVTFCP